MSKPTPARYRTTNWSIYTASLRKRGSLLIWLDSKGVFDGLGAWFGRVLRDTAVGDLIRKFM